VQLPGRPNSMAAANRLTVVAAVLLLWGGWIFVNLFSLQVTHHAQYQASAKKQQEKEVDIPAPRGTIFDRNGQPMAISVPAASVSVNPMQITDPKFAAELLGGILHLDQQVLYRRLYNARQDRRGFLWVKRRIDTFETARMNALNLEWATLATESTRHYPKGETGSHVVGTVLQDETGVVGVEKALDKSLHGKAGSELMVRDVRHKGIDSHIDAAPQDGIPVTLTIDERLQYIAERELKAGVELKHARYGTAIVMNPYTGEILALANYPTYDPNKRVQPSDNPKARLNLGVSVPFEPGSIFKVVTLSAALETTNLTPDSPIATGGGVLKLPGRVIHEAHHGYGTISMQQVLEKSSNIGAIMIGARVGREKMYEYVRRFGFGEKSGVGLPAESRGLFRTLDRWGTTSLASVSMGQEVSTTSVQLARACSVIANGGMLVRPTVILKRGNKPEPREAPVRILKPDTVMKMRMMMEGVVLRGTARLTARLDGYTSAGKTGTAQIFENGHYTHLYNASFMGFAPVTNPQLVIVVTLNGTAGDSGMGGAAAAPVFKAIATEALRMMDVPKDIPEELAETKKPKKNDNAVEDVSIAGLAGDSIMAEDHTVKELLAEEEKLAQLAAAAQAAEIPAAANGAPVLALAAPAGVSTPLVPPPLASTPRSPAPVVPPAATGPTVPDFRGKSMRSVVEEASAHGIEVMIEGSGVARAQLPLPGKPLRPGERIRIVFTR
jgi:cell division protein FtsI (penicillin-binding protein 3)